jgi:predicted Ser/Thr protein kinase
MKEEMMDIDFINNCVNDIQVKNVINQDVEVVNNSPLVMMGKGRQGAVFQVTEDICVKVFGNEEDCEREYYALSLGQHTNLFPKLYAKGPRHIAMEIIKGVDLREYLQSQPLTEEISLKLIEMLSIFKEIGFERIDHHKRQIYLQPEGNLKVIDVARTVWRDRVYPYPRKLLTSLGEKNKELFLSHVQAFDPQLYEEWMHYIRMEEISRQIYDVLINQEKDISSIKKLSKKLLTTEDEKKYVVLLEGLMYKVFKEEWVKTMLVLGHSPDDVMEKIDEYWNYHESDYYKKDGDKKKDKNRSQDREKYREKGRHHHERGRHYEKGKHRHRHR